VAPLFVAVLLTLRCGPGLDVTRSACTYVAQWAIADDFAYLTNTGSLPQGIAIDGSGTIDVAGTTKGVPHWLVRKSSDGGVTWAVSDDYLYGASGSTSAAASAAMDPSGNLYVVGVGSDGTLSHWIVRKLACQ
jgi:hypothetical protein